MLTATEKKRYLDLDPKFDDMICNLHATARQPRGIFGEIRKAVAIARKFNQEVVRPLALETERRLQKDPTYVPAELVEAANQWGLYTMWLPKLFGGKGYCFPSMSVFMEEVASECLGIANLIGVHYLGLSMLMAPWNTRIIKRICNDIVAGEKSGKPCILSFAMTEPGSGTDTPEIELLDRANVACQTKKVAGGYRVSGSKIFISSGVLSTWHMVVAFADLDAPADNGVFFAVKTGTPGFTVGKKENKMGQKACPANELIFDDCFIPDELVCMDTDQMKRLARPPRETYQQVLDYVVSTTRAAVCALGTGAARGAYREALAFAAETRVNGKRLIDQEWAQSTLARMHRNVAAARLFYMESNYANGLYGFFKALQVKPTYYLLKWMPAGLVSRLMAPFLGTRFATWMFRKLQLDTQPDEEMNRISAWSTMAKFAGSDAAMENCQIALELMGQAGLRLDNRVEKNFRDTKLLQIYEGTNQINRLLLFKSLTRYSHPDVAMFDE